MDANEDRERCRFQRRHEGRVVARIGDQQRVSTNGEGQQDVRVERHDVVHRQTADHRLTAVFEGIGRVGEVLHRVGDDVGLCQHHPLWRPGRAAGVLQQRQLVRGALGVGRGQTTAALHRLPEADRPGGQVPQRRRFPQLQREVDDPFLRCRVAIGTRHSHAVDNAGPGKGLIGEGRGAEGDDRLGAAVFDDVADFPRRVERVRRHRHKSGFPDRQEGNRRRHQVRHLHHHPVAGLEALKARKVRGEIIHHLPELGVGEGLQDRRVGGLIAIGRHGVFKHIENMAVALRVDFGGNCVGHAASSSPTKSVPGSLCGISVQHGQTLGRPAGRCNETACTIVAFYRPDPGLVCIQNGAILPSPAAKTPQSKPIIMNAFSPLLTMTYSD